MKRFLAIILSVIMLLPAVNVYALDNVPTATVDEITAEGYDKAYSFTPDETAADAAAGEYASYTADYAVSFDKDIPTGAVRLAFSFDGYNEGEWEIVDVPETKAGEEIRLLDCVVEKTEKEARFTYAEAVGSIGTFNVGALGIDAAKVKVNFEFNIYESAEAAEAAATIASAEYTFPASETVPTASVERADSDSLAPAYSITPDQSAYQAAGSIYSDYKADFEVSFDHDMDEGALKLAFAYDGYNDGKLDTFDIPYVDAGEKISLLDRVIAATSMSSDFTYADVADKIKSFYVGATGIDEKYDIKMTIEFNLYDPANPDTPALTVASQEYTFVDDGITEITLDVKNGDDIADTFTRTARVAKDDNSGRIYKITIPKGSYTSSSQLKLWSNTYLYMNGVTIKHTTSDSVMLRFGNKSDLDAKPVTGYNGFQNIHIIGGTFDGGGLDQALIKIGHSKNISFKNVNFKNVKDSHMLEAGACGNLTIENCTFTGFSGNWGATQNYEAVQFDVTDPKGDHFDGYKSNNDETACNNITVKGCTFKNLQKGMGVHTGVANLYCNNMIFENNTFENITGYAIIGTNFTNSKINGNTIKNCGAGIIFNTMVAGYKNFYTSKKHSNSHPSYTSANIQIMNNTITVTTGYKVIYNNIGYGIRLYGENVPKATGNTPKGDFRCAGVRVQNNTINLNATGYGIWLYGAAANVINNNRINVNLVKKGKGGNGDGIRLQQSAKNTISNNVITNSTTSGYDKEMSGITLCESSVSNNSSNNKITNAKKDGFHIDSAKSNVLTSNTITGAGRDAIHSDKSASLKITSNIISKPKRNGISLNAGKSSKIEKNTVTSCKQNGIHLEKSDSVTCNKNKITSAGKNGISLYGSKKTVLTNNTITKSKQYGMYSSLAKKKAIKKDKGNKIKKSKKRARSWSK